MAERSTSEESSAKKMALVFLLPSLAGGGAERVAAMLLPFLARSFDLTLALLDGRIAYAIPGDIRCMAFSKRIGGAITRLATGPYFLFRLVRLVRKSGADAVLSFMEEANNINILASMITGHKAILSQRIVPHMQYAGKGVLGRLILSMSKRLYPKAAHVLAVSAQIRRSLLEDFGLDPGQVTFVPNPVDVSSLQRRAAAPPSLPSLPFQRPYLLHVGRLRMSQKGQDIAIKAFSQMRERWPELLLVLAGEGPDRKRIEAMVDDLGLAGRVVLPGWLNDPAPLMARAEAFILSSRYEGWPNVLLEAMACGCPVVACDCESGPREILGDSRYGALVPRDDPDALARAVESILEGGHSSRNLWQERGRKRAEELSTEHIGPRYVKLVVASLNNHTLQQGGRHEI